MTDDQRSLPTAHRVLAGTSLLAVLLVVLGSVASLIEIINAPAPVFRWAAAGILVVASLCWLVAVLHGMPSVPGNRNLGYPGLPLRVKGQPESRDQPARFTCTGADRCVVVPSPSWACALLPQHHRPPSVR